MAKVSSTDIEKLNQTISTASDISSSDINEATKEVTDAISGLGKGLVLNPKKKTNNTKTEKDVKAELDGLRVYCPEMGNVADLLIGANTSLEGIENKTEEANEGSSEGSSEDETTINTDSVEPKDLANLTNLSAITGTGLAIVGNILNQLKDISDQILTAINQSLGTDVESEKPKEEGTDSKGVLANFFQGISGPLESIAGSILMLSIAMAVLSTINITGELIGTIFLLDVFMITTFSILSDISEEYQSSGAKESMDPKSENENSIVNIIKNFAILMAIVTGTFILINIMVTFLQDNWLQTILGLVIIFGVTLGTMVALTAISNAMLPMVDNENSPIAEFIKGFAILIGTVVGLSLLCYFLYPIIMQGMLYAGLILGVTITMLMSSLTSALASIQAISGEQIKQFQNLLNSITTLIIVISVLTIVLGLIPIPIIAQGMITVGLLVGLTSLLIYMITSSLQKIEFVEEAQIQRLTTLIIATTVLIGVLGILVVVLGAIPITTLAQGLIAVGALVTIPLVLLKTLPKLAQNEEQVLQALEGLVVASLLVAGISALAFLAIGLLGGFNLAQVVTSMLAITIMTALVLGVSVAMIGLAALAASSTASIGPALATIGIAGVFVFVIAGEFVAIRAILPNVDVQEAITQIAVVALMSATILAVGVIMIALGAMAIPLSLASVFALRSVRIVTEFITDLVGEMGKLSESITAIQGVDISFIAAGIQSISSIVTELNRLADVMTQFAIVGATLTLTLVVSTVTLFAINGLLPAFIVGILDLRSRLSLLNLIPAGEMNFETLNNTINQLNTFSQVINDFTAPSLVKMIAVGAAMRFAGSLAKQIAKISNTENIEKITNLSTSLSQLASNASSLQGLANSLREVANATRELNEVQNSKGKTNIEDLTGETFNIKNNVENLSKTNIKSENNNSKLNETLSKLNDSLTEMLDVNRNIQRAVLSISEESKLERESGTNKAKVASEFDM